MTPPSGGAGVGWGAELRPRVVVYLDPVKVPGLYRNCGCDIDPIVFGHICQEDEEAA